MRKFAILAVFGAAIGSANAALLSFGASLEPRFEVGHVVNGTNSFTNGAVGFSLDTVTGAIQGTIAGLSLSSAVTGFHIHQAPVGVNGPIVVDLADLPRYYQNVTTDINGRVYATYGFSGNVSTALRNGATLASVVAALTSGNAYANMHTSINPAGEIRGQLCETEAVPEPASLAALGLGAAAMLRRRRKA